MKGGSAFWYFVFGNRSPEQWYISHSDSLSLSVKRSGH